MCFFHSDTALRTIYQRHISGCSWRDLILKQLRDLTESVKKYEYPQAIDNVSCYFHEIVCPLSIVLYP